MRFIVISIERNKVFFVNYYIVIIMIEYSLMFFELIWINYIIWYVFFLRKKIFNFLVEVIVLRIVCLFKDFDNL